MKIWRIEHKCPTPHGPTRGCTVDSNNWDNPSYGSVLEPPQGDETMAHLNMNVMQEYIFGTLPEQFPRWWGTYVSGYDEFGEPVWTNAPEVLKGDWFAVQYEVEDTAVHIGKNQVMFDSYRCVEVMRTQTDYPL